MSKNQYDEKFDEAIKVAVISDLDIGIKSIINRAMDREFNENDNLSNTNKETSIKKYY